MGESACTMQCCPVQRLEGPWSNDKAVCCAGPQTKCLVYIVRSWLASFLPHR